MDNKELLGLVTEEVLQELLELQERTYGPFTFHKTPSNQGEWIECEGGSGTYYQKHISYKTIHGKLNGVVKVWKHWVFDPCQQVLLKDLRTVRKPIYEDSFYSRKLLQEETPYWVAELFIQNLPWKREKRKEELTWLRTRNDPRTLGAPRVLGAKENGSNTKTTPVKYVT